MPDYLISKETLTELGNTIREVTGENKLLTPSEMSGALLAHKTPDYITLKNVYCCENSDNVTEVVSLPIFGYTSNGYTITGALPLSHGWWAWAGTNWYNGNTSKGWFNYSGGPMNNINYKAATNGLETAYFHNQKNGNNINVYGSHAKIRDNDYLVTSKFSSYSDDTSTATCYLYRVKFTVTDSATYPTYSRTSISLGSAYSTRVYSLLNNKWIVFYKTAVKTTSYKIYGLNDSDTLTEITSGTMTDICPGTTGMSWGLVPLKNNRFLHICSNSADENTKSYRIMVVNNDNSLSFTDWVAGTVTDNSVIQPIIIDYNNYKIVILTKSADINEVVCISSNNTIGVSAIDFESISGTFLPARTSPLKLWAIKSAQGKYHSSLDLSVSILNNIASISFNETQYPVTCDYDNIKQFNDMSYMWRQPPTGWHDIYALDSDADFMLCQGGYLNGYDGSYYQSGSFSPFALYKSFDCIYPLSATTAIKTEPIIGQITGQAGEVVEGKFLLKK